MATYDNLPIYHASYTLLLELFRFTREFTREYKYTIGETIKQEIIELMMRIFRANSDPRERPALIREARIRIETIRLLIRLTHDLKQIPLEKFVDLNVRIESISKQLTGWQRSAGPA